MAKLKGWIHADPFIGYLKFRLTLQLTTYLLYQFYIIYSMHQSKYLVLLRADSIYRKFWNGLRDILVPLHRLLNSELIVTSIVWNQYYSIITWPPVAVMCVADMYGKAINRGWCNSKKSTWKSITMRMKIPKIVVIIYLDNLVLIILVWLILILTGININQRINTNQWSIEL